MDSPTKKINDGTAADCPIARLPEELLSAVISCISPRDACRAAEVSPAFRAAADSDAVWSTFLPRDLPPLADGELPPAPMSKKRLYLLLSDHPLLLRDRLKSFWLDRETGAKCYMLSARALQIAWGDTPQHWRWIPLTDSRFSEGAQLLDVCWLEIGGKIHSMMLSQNSAYAAYMVFKIADTFNGQNYAVQEAYVRVGESTSTRRVSLQGYDNEDDDVLLPQERSDGWMELEMGEFYNEEGDHGEVCVRFRETEGGKWKTGLIVQGIEIRPKKSG